MERRDKKFGENQQISQRNVKSVSNTLKLNEVQDSFGMKVLFAHPNLSSKGYAITLIKLNRKPQTQKFKTPINK